MSDLNRGSCAFSLVCSEVHSFSGSHYLCYHTTRPDLSTDLGFFRGFFRGLARHAGHVGRWRPRRVAPRGQCGSGAARPLESIFDKTGHGVIDACGCGSSFRGGSPPVYRKLFTVVAGHPSLPNCYKDCAVSARQGPRAGVSFELLEGGAVAPRGRTANLAGSPGQHGRASG
jgi:hypothetical protein